VILQNIKALKMFNFGKRKFFNFFSLGFWDLLFPPNQAECKQWHDGETRVNSNDVYELIDNKQSSKGSSDRLPENGHSYLGDGTAHILITGLLTSDVITVPAYSDLPTCTVNGRLDIANLDKVADVTIKRSSVAIGVYFCDEDSKTTGNISYNSIPDVANALPNGIITSHVVADFFIDNIDVTISKQNDFGYATKTGVDGKIPLDPLGVPVADYDVLYTGDVRNNSKLVNAGHGVFTGSEYLTCTLVGTETVVSSWGTSTASITANKIDFTSGTMGLLLLSNGDLYKFSDGYGLLIQECVNDNHATLVGATLADFWKNDATGTLRNSNLYDGFSGGIWFDMSTSLLTTATRPASSNIELHTKFQLGSSQHLRFISKADGNYLAYWSRSVNTLYLKNDTGTLVVITGLPTVTDTEWINIDFTLSGGNYSLTVKDFTDTGSLAGTMTITNIYVGTGQEIRMPQTIKSYSISIDGTLYDYDFSNIGATLTSPNGFDATLVNSEIISIPSKNDNSGLDIAGDTLTNPQASTKENYYYHNGAEAEILNYKVPALYLADALLTTPILYNHTAEEPISILYSEKEYDYGNEHILFSNTEDKAWRDQILYSAVQSGQNLDDILDFISDHITNYVPSTAYAPTTTYS